MASFGSPKHKQKTLEFTQPFGVHFELEFILIQWLNEEDWIKSIYIKYITYNFSIAIRPHVCGSWNITQKKKIEITYNAHL